MAAEDIRAREQEWRIATDLEGRVKLVNPAPRISLNLQARQTHQDEPKSKCMHCSKRPQTCHRISLRRVLATNRASHRERFLLAARANSTIFVEDSASPIHDAEGKMTGASP